MKNEEDESSRKGEQEGWRRRSGKREKGDRGIRRVSKRISGIGRDPRNDQLIDSPRGGEHHRARRGGWAR